MDLCSQPSGATATSEAEISMASFAQVNAFCTTLVVLAQCLTLGGIPDGAGEIADTLCKYFDSEVRHHRTEQEWALFPSLRTCVDDNVDEIIDRFTVEHRSLERDWRFLRAELRNLGAGRAAALGTEAVTRFTTLYRSHMFNEYNLFTTLEVRIQGLVQT